MRFAIFEITISVLRRVYEALKRGTWRGLPEGVIIGRHTYEYSRDTFLMWRPSDRIVVGNFCSISVGVRMLGGGEHPLNMVSTYPLRTLLMRADGNNYDVKSKGPTSIGNDVWIGVDALILSGVSVGNGAVIGAGSVVTANVPPYAIVVGNPARIIGYRFSEDRIEKLLKIEWWNWSDEAIKAADAEFYSDVDEFISKYS